MLPALLLTLMLLLLLLLLPTLFLMLHVEIVLMLKRQLILIQCITVLTLDSVHFLIILTIYSINSLLVHLTQFRGEPWEVLGMLVS